MASAGHDPLLQPYTLKHLVFRNRLMSSAHEPAYTIDGLPKTRYRLYHAEKARGGIGLTMIGGSSIVAPDSPQAFGNIVLYKDEVVPWLRELCDDVHALGARVMIQITHLGRRTNWNKADWLPVIAPSAVREPAHRAFPKAMEDHDFRRVLAAYADAAERCKAGGLDGVEFEMYGHLLDQFWSKATNRREDAYGGDLANRLRFSLEVLQAVRARVGQAFVLGVRMVCDEDWERGLSREEGVEIARRLAASGLIDFINVIRGHIETDEALSHVIPNMGTASAPHLDFAGEVRQATQFPVFHAARIQDVATARHAIAAGKVDLIGMTRAHMADPHIVRKIMAGAEADVRPCVGMGYCIDRIYFGGEALCIHNPATGREETMPHVLRVAEGPKKTVVIVGAGPAGLEAARVAGERGHRVMVFEAGAEPGGQVLLTAALKRRREIMGLIDWRMAQCDKHGVDFRFHTYADQSTVLEARPDIVVLATGGVPNLSFLDSGEELATTTWDILSGAVKPGESVILYDDNGAHPGFTAAEFLAEAGAHLEFVTPERILAPEVGGTNYPAYLRAFAVHNVGVTLNMRLERIKRDGNGLVAVFFDEYGRRRIEKRADQIVVEHGTVPVEDLYLALKELSFNRGEIDEAALIANRPQTVRANPDGGFALFRIGDAVASRNIHAAVYDALRLAKDF
jgi:2,4-dienoyl-CoA reductase-like NADH-dependent reductase (Old Yellow Enzyme family)